MNSKDQTPPCQHKFVSNGVVYKTGSQLPGSGAHSIEYFDAFFCEKCLQQEIKSLGVHGNIYGELKFNARPARY